MNRAWAVALCTGLSGCGGMTAIYDRGEADDSCETVLWYRDADSDGYGGDALVEELCEGESLDGYTTVAGDCDDSTGLIAPGRTEKCNEVDDDCNGKIDDDPMDGQTFYADNDRDGQGSAADRVIACDPPQGYVTDNSDCDDGDSSIYEGAEEVCDGADNDCDGVVDDPDELPVETWFFDGDGDGFGNPDVSIEACAEPSGHVPNGDDCDDELPGVSPDAEEVCDDGVDQDCDGVDNGCWASHLSEPFSATSSTGQWCGSEALVHWTYYGEWTFRECQEKANATGTQWFVGQWTTYTVGWIGDQDGTNAVVTSATDWGNEVIVSSKSLASCVLGQVDHRTEPTVSPVEQTYVDPEGRRWVYWEIVAQTHSQAMAFADDRGARVINPNSVGRIGEYWMTAPTHWCHAGAEFNGGGSCNSDNSCNFIVGYWE